MKIKYVKWLGFIGALCAGAAQVIAGDVVTGAGVIAAAFSSAGIFTAS